MIGPLVAACVAIVAASVLGGLVPLVGRLTHTRLQVYLSAASGSMLGAAFFHMMPEAVEGGGPRVLRWVAAGLVALFLLERFFSYHQHEAPGDGRVPDSAPGGPKRPQWDLWAAAVGMALHSLIGGLALASVVVSEGGASGGRFGAASWSVLVATLVHKPADALTVVSLILRAGLPPIRAHAINLAFAMMIPAGVALFFVGLSALNPMDREALTAPTLAFSAGTFLCIALGDVMPELHFHAHDRVKLSAALLAGVLLMWLASALGHGESGG